MSDKNIQIPIKGDSSIHLLLCESQSNFSTKFKKIKESWMRLYFPNTFPKSFEIKRDDNLFRNLEFSNVTNSLFMTYDISSMKSMTNNFYMKIIHPTPFINLVTAMETKSSVLKSDEILSAIKKCSGFVHCFQEITTLNSKRMELISSTNCDHLIRLDVNKFFSSFYLHFISALKSGSVLTSREAFSGKESNEWDGLLDAAIRNCQHTETHGIPINGDIFRSIGDVVLIFIDAMIVDKFLEQSLTRDDVIILRYSDNYDVFATKESMDIVLDSIIKVFHSFQLSLTIYSQGLVSLDRFPLTTDLNYLNNRELSHFLIKHKNDPDYDDIVASVCAVFFELFLKSNINPSCYMPDLVYILKHNPCSIKYFTDLAISSYKSNVVCEYKKLGSKMLVAYESYPFRALPCTQIICICHYFLKLPMDDDVMSKLDRLLHKFNLQNDAIIRLYMKALQFTVNDDCSYEQQHCLNQFDLKSGGNWLLEQIETVVNR